MIFAIGAGRIGNFLRKNSAIARWQGKVVGAIYCALGIRLALQDR
jgi:threonine/homoserine/homoserine lactone efflux protein